MADNAENALWEPGIYELATTDQVIGGTGGVSNRPNVELGNRTARIKAALNEQGIFVDETEHEFWGANVDPTAAFEGSVGDGDVVWFDYSQSRYELALAESGGGSAATGTVAGIADVTNGRVVNGGLIRITLTQSFAQGDLVYLSGVLAGATATAVSSSVVGRIMWKISTYDVILNLNNANMIARHSEIYDNEPTKHFTVGSILHSAINDDESSLHFTVGSILHSAINDNQSTKHRLINDAGVSSTELWSSSKINSTIDLAGGAHSPGIPLFPLLKYNMNENVASQEINSSSFNPPTAPGQQTYNWDNGVAPGYFLGTQPNGWSSLYTGSSLAGGLRDMYANVYLTSGSPRYICLQGTILNNYNNTNAAVRLVMGPVGSAGSGAGNVVSTIGGPYGNFTGGGVGTAGATGYSSNNDYAYSFAIFLDTNALSKPNFYSLTIQTYKSTGTANVFFSYMKCYWCATAATLTPYHTPI